MNLERITVNPQQCGGHPCIRGLRIRVQEVLELQAAGAIAEEMILEDYPYLDREDISATLQYAAHQIDHAILFVACCASWWMPSFRPHGITAQGKTAEHVADVGMARASDRKIWDSARQTSAVIVAKDEDFAIHVIHGDGPTVLWLHLGNCWRQALLDRFACQPVATDPEHFASEGNAPGAERVTPPGGGEPL